MFCRGTWFDTMPFKCPSALMFQNVPSSLTIAGPGAFTYTNPYSARACMMCPVVFKVCLKPAKAIGPPPLVKDVWVTGHRAIYAGITLTTERQVDLSVFCGAKVFRMQDSIGFIMRMVARCCGLVLTTNEQYIVSAGRYQPA